MGVEYVSDSTPSPMNRSTTATIVALVALVILAILAYISLSGGGGQDGIVDANTVDADFAALEEIVQDSRMADENGQLDETGRASMKVAFDAHVRGIKAYLTDLEADGKTQEAQLVRARLRSSLRLGTQLFGRDMEAQTSTGTLSE